MKGLEIGARGISCVSRRVLPSTFQYIQGKDRCAKKNFHKMGMEEIWIRKQEEN